MGLGAGGWGQDHASGPQGSHSGVWKALAVVPTPAAEAVC